MESIRNLILFVLGGGLLLLTLRSLRAHRLKERYVIIFILLGLPFIFLGFWTEGVGYIGKILGIDYRTISLLGVTFFFILLRNINI